MTEMKECACGGNLIKTSIERNGVRLYGMKCKKCGEIYFPSSEMMRYEILTSKSSLIRKVRKSGDSMIVTVPKQIVEKFGVHENDMIYFETDKENKINLKIIHSHGRGDR